MPRAKHTAIEKLAPLEAFRFSGMSQNAFELQHGLSNHRLKLWQALFERDGFDGLKEATKNQHYSTAFKLAAVLAYNNGEGTLHEITLRLGLRSQSTLRDWISKYNRDKTVTASPFRKQAPTMSRKTTLEERIEAVEYVTKQKHSYAETAEHRVRLSGVLDLFGRRLIAYNFSQTETSAAEVELFTRSFDFAGHACPVVHTD